MRLLLGDETAFLMIMPSTGGRRIALAGVGEWALAFIVAENNKKRRKKRFGGTRFNRFLRPNFGAALGDN